MALWQELFGKAFFYHLRLKLLALSLFHGYGSLCRFDAPGVRVCPAALSRDVKDKALCGKLLFPIHYAVCFHLGTVTSFCTSVAGAPPRTQPLNV